MAMVLPDCRVDAPPVAIFELAVLDAPPSAACAISLGSGLRSKRVDSVKVARADDASDTMFRSAERHVLALVVLDGDESGANPDVIPARARRDMMLYFIFFVDMFAFLCCSNKEWKCMLWIDSCISQ